MSISRCVSEVLSIVLPIYFFDAEITRSFYFQFLSSVLLFEENDKKKEKNIFSKKQTYKPQQRKIIKCLIHTKIYKDVNP